MQIKLQLEHSSSKLQTAILTELLVLIFNPAIAVMFMVMLKKTSQHRACIFR
eukprot:COSAG02_NODE_2476_length_8733_cov_9.786542_6_plen_52_part_00